MTEAHDNSAAQIPAVLAAGLELFAATWLEKWAEAGGFAYLGADGEGGLGYPTYHDSPAYVKLADDLTVQSRDYQETWRDAHYHGTMRAMLGVLDALPWGRDALKSHMRSHGMRSYFHGIGATP